MSLVRPGRSSIFVILRFRLKNFGRIGRVCTTFGMPRRSIFFAKFQHDPAKHVKILANRRLHRETKQILNTDRPYSSPAGLREPKPEPVDEEPLSPHKFMYRWKGIFEGFLRRTAEEIIDVAVRDVISEVDRLVFEEEASDVNM